MWCKTCNIETNDETCPICGSKTVEDIPVEVYWCPECKVPIINTTTQADKGSCPLCGHKTKYMSADLRPVFPEERLLLELLLEKKPHEYVQKSVWAANSSYYIDGKRVALPAKLFEKANTDDLSKKIEEYKGSNTLIFMPSDSVKLIETGSTTSWMKPLGLCGMQRQSLMKTDLWYPFRVVKIQQLQPI